MGASSKKSGSHRELGLSPNRFYIPQIVNFPDKQQN